MIDNFVYLIPIVGVVAVFTFVAIAVWSDNRRKERESYYKHETYRKIMELPDESGGGVLTLMREEEMQEQRRRIEGMRLGGMITFATGVGVMIFLYFLVEGVALYWAGLIPVLIGLVLLIYGYFLVDSPNGQQGPETKA